MTMDNLEIIIGLTNEEAEKLQELEKTTDYFRIAELRHRLPGGVGGARSENASNYMATIQFYPHKGPLCES